jgi:hypothetical protein
MRTSDPKQPFTLTRQVGSNADKTDFRRRRSIGRLLHISDSSTLRVHA